MARQEKKPHDDWEDTWDARAQALTRVLGKPADIVGHAMIPFALGGSADVMHFPDYVPGITYVTAEMTGQDVGQLATSLGHYELMICAKQALPEAAEFVSQLAKYSCEAKLEPGHTMDCGKFFGDSAIRAVLFATPGEQPTYFQFLGKRYGLLRCIGITAAELKFARTRGSERLLKLLREHQVFPYTVPDRRSVPLPGGGSFFGRMFGR